MAEILFRGKRIDNGNWIVGQLLRYEDGRARIVESHTDIFCYEKDSSIIQTVAHEVIPDTVGQFTGLTDKNGKKIFEGDIVKAERIYNGLYWTGCVVWWHGCFAIQGIKDSNNVPAIDLFRNYEVIGNIHDNPELLEVE